MSDAVRELASVSVEDVIAITKEVWSSFVDMDLRVAPAETAVLSAPALTAVVRICGAWDGAVRLECPVAHATAAAAAMFAIEPGAVSDETARDAIGELTNVVCGNVKSLLPAPSELSIPVVSPSDGSGNAPVGADLLRRVAFVASTGALHISVWEGGPA